MPCFRAAFPTQSCTCIQVGNWEHLCMLRTINIIHKSTLAQLKTFSTRPCCSYYAFLSWSAHDPWDIRTYLEKLCLAGNVPHKRHGEDGATVRLLRHRHSDRRHMIVELLLRFAHS